MSRFILGDCVQVMSRFPSRAVDFILTDPPYLVGYRDRTGRTLAGDNTPERLEPACRQMYRVLKQDGRLAIADIVQLKPVPESVKHSIELWVGCVSGALTLEAYQETLRRAGFTQIEIVPVSVYGKSMIEELARDQKLEGMYTAQDADLLDGAFASAHVKARK